MPFSSYASVHEPVRIWAVQGSVADDADRATHAPRMVGRTPDIDVERATVPSSPASDQLPLDAGLELPSR